MKGVAGIIVAAIVVSVGILIPIKKVGAYGQELIPNGGFEASPLGDGWAYLNSAVGAWTPEVWHSGYRGANLAPNPYWTSQMELEQIKDGALVSHIVLPADASSIYFSFWYKFIWDQAPGSVAKFEIKVFNPYDRSEVWIDIKPEPKADAGWRQTTIDLSFLRGRAVEFSFFGYMNANAGWLSGAKVLLDDVSVVATLPDPPTPSVLGATAVIRVPILKQVQKSIWAFTWNKKKDSKIVLLGKNFTTKVRVKINKTEIKSVKVANSKSIVITVKIGTLKKGKYDVTVINSNGKSVTLKKALTIK